MQYIYANNLIHVSLFEQTIDHPLLGHLHSVEAKFGPGKCA